MTRAPGARTARRGAAEPREPAPARASARNPTGVTTPSRRGCCTRGATRGVMYDLAQEQDRDRDGPAPGQVRPQEPLDPADRVGPPGRVERIEGRPGRPPRRRPGSTPPGGRGTGPSRPGTGAAGTSRSAWCRPPTRPGRRRRRPIPSVGVPPSGARPDGLDRLGEGEDRADPEARQEARRSGVVPVGEEVGLEDPGPGRQRGGPGAPTPRDEAAKVARPSG